MVARPRPGKLSQPVALVTGFDAFGGDTLNPSWLIAQALHGQQIAGHRVLAAQLPTVFATSLQVLQSHLLQYQPALVVCLGQAGGRGAISLERVAINISDARIADNARNQPIDTPVVPHGPAAYFTGLPLKAMLAAMQEAGIACEVSQTAGTFVCNQVFYGLMHALATQHRFKAVRGGFIHVPWLPQQGMPAMSLEEMVRGITVALRCALGTSQDINLGAGSLH